VGTAGFGVAALVQVRSVMPPADTTSPVGSLTVAVLADSGKSATVVSAGKRCGLPIRDTADCQSALPSLGCVGAVQFLFDEQE
jgi:hypothetical protein